MGGGRSEWESYGNLAGGKSVSCRLSPGIAFVDEEDVNDEPEIVVREPEGKEGR